MDNLALRLVYEKYTISKSDDDFKSLWAGTRLFLVKKLKQWKPKSSRIEDVVHWTIMKLIEKVDQLTQTDNLQSIENFGAYSYTTAKRQLIKRENEDRRGIVHNQFKVIEQNQEGHKNYLNDEYQINPCLRKLVFATTQGLLTKTEKIIIEGLVRYSRGVSAEVKDYAPISRKVRSKVQAELKMKSPTFSNHMKRICEKIVTMEPAKWGDSFEEVVGYLIVQARRLKHQEDYYAALILYQSIALIEPKYWNEVRDPRTLRTQGRFWDALYNIGYCQIRAGQLGLAIKEYERFIEMLKNAPNNHYCQLSLNSVASGNSLQEEMISWSPTSPRKIYYHKASIGIIEENPLRELFNTRHFFLGLGLNQLGTIHFKTDLEKAIELFQEGFSYTPHDMVIVCNLLETNILMQNFSAAREIYDKHCDNPAFRKTLQILSEEIVSKLKITTRQLDTNNNKS